MKPIPLASAAGTLKDGHLEPPQLDNLSIGFITLL